MAVTLSGSEGLFTRLGHITYAANTLDTNRGSAAETRALLIDSDFEAADRAVTDGLFESLAEYRTASEGWLRALAGLVSQTVIQQVDRDAKLIELTLAEALPELARQMETAGASINRPTLSSSVAYGSANQGDAKVLCSLTDGTGKPLDYAFSETVRVRCDGGDEFAESWTAVADGAVPVTDYRWPQGSGGLATLSTLEPDAIAAPVLTDGGFEAWTDASTPTSWTATTGTGGSDFARSTDSFRGTYCLLLTSDGSEATKLKQVPSTELEPNTVYAVGFWAKKSGNDAAGVVRAALVTSANAVINDDAGNANSISATIASGGDISTSYTFVGGFFRTPRRVPTTTAFQIGWSVAPSNGVTVKIDGIVCEKATQLYAGGPYLAVVAGATFPGLGDSAVVTVSNSLGKDSFARSLDRFLSLRDLGVVIPSAASETIADSLIA